MNLNNLRKRVDKIRSEYNLAHATLRTERNRLQTLRQEISHIEQAREIIQVVAQQIEQQAHKKIAHVVTACLQTVFTDKNYGFKIRFDRKRNRTEAKLILLNDGHEIEDPLEGDSGGVLDVASFALQLSAIMLTKPALRRIMVLDEPFKFVSPEYRDNVQQMLEKLAEEFDIQLIMVTSHQSQVAAGKVIEL